MRQVTAQQEVGWQIVLGILFGLVAVAILLCGPEFLAWLLR